MIVVYFDCCIHCEHSEDEGEDLDRPERPDRHLRACPGGCNNHQLGD